jgi:hypothetical protein
MDWKAILPQQSDGYTSSSMITPKLILTDVWGDGGGPTALGDVKKLSSTFNASLEAGLDKIVVTLHDSNDKTANNLEQYLSMWKKRMPGKKDTMLPGYFSK